jgi:hypothetical protein
LGDLYAAGFSDNALFIEGQKKVLIRNIMGNSALAGGGEFKTPLMADNVGGLLLGGKYTWTALVFQWYCAFHASRCIINRSNNKTTGPFSNLQFQVQKLPFSGCRLWNIAGVATGAANPYFVRSGYISNYNRVDNALKILLSLWIGGNDV